MEPLRSGNAGVALPRLVARGRNRIEAVPPKGVTPCDTAGSQPQTPTGTVGAYGLGGVR